jgi:hypothetical protein
MRFQTGNSRAEVSSVAWAEISHTKLGEVEVERRLLAYGGKNIDLRAFGQNFIYTDHPHRRGTADRRDRGGGNIHRQAFQPKRLDVPGNYVTLGVRCRRLNQRTGAVVPDNYAPDNDVNSGPEENVKALKSNVAGELCSERLDCPVPNCSPPGRRKGVGHQ